jgi:hypothetical protein
MTEDTARTVQSEAATLPLFAATLLLSAFLLFSVQPFFAKMVLPLLGGSPAVWSVAMVFFQAMLRQSGLGALEADRAADWIQEKLRERGIDPYRYNTTCPFVEKVWKRSEQIGKKEYTIVVHGTYPYLVLRHGNNVIGLRRSP